MVDYAWPEQPTVVGTSVKRVDGPAKITGRAKYSYDINRPGMLHGVFLGCPQAHAEVVAIDTSKAASMPGVKGIYFVRGSQESTIGAEFLYQGEPILAVAAETEAQAYDALAVLAKSIQYKDLGHAVKESVAKQPDAPRVSTKDDNVISGRGVDKGDVDAALANAAAKVERTYGMPVISHMCLEAHGSVAEWEGDKLTIWCSTQATQGVAQELAKHFSVPATDVRCITHYMGGGFGSKFNPGNEGFAAAALARMTGRPVKLMLDRKMEHSAGVRPSSYAAIRAGADSSGKLIAFHAEQSGTPGVGGSAGFPLPYVYEDIPNVKTNLESIRINIHERRAYRAPGHPQSCFIMEAVMDDLAGQLGMDPIAMRLANLEPEGGKDLVHQIYRKQLEIGKKLIGWDEKYHPPGQAPQKGPVKRGLGMGLHKWGGRGVPREQITVEINADGSVLAQSSTQDLGTANRTVLAIVVAEVLGLRPEQVKVEIGESQWARSHGSGGSTTCPSTAPASLIAAIDARQALFEKIAPLLETTADKLVAKEGKVHVADGDRSLTWADACRKLGMDRISVTGEYTLRLYSTAGLSDVNVGGCQFAEVEVDEETGVVRVLHIVAVQDCGLIINKLACESQVAGGVVMSVNNALYEERVMDQATGYMLNPDMEFYKLGMITDMPRITVHMFDDPISTKRGVIGIGEPPTISTAATIGNAIYNATGVRVPFAPFTPKNVLAAIANSKSGGTA